MLKKTMAIVLSMVMLIMICPIGTVFGALPTDTLVVDSSTNAAITEGRWFDDFSQFTEEITTKFSNYPSRSGGTSEVFCDKNWATIYQIVDADPSENVTNMALKVEPTSNITVPINSVTLNENQVLRYSHDVMINDMATTATEGVTYESILTFGGTAGGGKTRFAIKPVASNGNLTYYLNYDWSNRCVIEQGKWYKMIFYLKGDMKTISAYFVNAETGEVLYTASETTFSSNITFTGFNANKEQYDKVGGYFLMDNVELLAYTPANFKPSVSKKSIADVGVATDVGTIDITLDQLVSAVPTSITLKADGKPDVTADVSTKNNTVGKKLNTYTLTLNSALEGSATYTVDLSGFVNAGGATANNFSFTTAAAAPLLTASTPASGATDVSVTTNEISLTFDQTIAEFPATLALTGGIEDITATISTTDNINFKATWSGELEGNTTYSLALTGFKNANGAACTKEAISFETENNGIIVLEDNFDDASKAVSTWKAQYGSNTAGSETLLYSYSDSNDSAFTSLTMVEGYNGSGTALSINTGDKTYYYTKSIYTNEAFSLADGEKFVVTWRFNLKKMSALDTENDKYGSSIPIGGCALTTDTNVNINDYITAINTRDGKPFIHHGNDNVSLGRTIEEDHWYNVYYTIESGDQHIYIVDTETGKLVYKRAKGSELSADAIPKLTTEQPARIYLCDPMRVKSPHIYNDSQEFLLDDFKIWRVNTTKEPQKLKVTNKDEGAVLDLDSEEVQSVSITYNQPVIPDASGFEVYKGVNSRNDLAYSSAFVKNTDFCSQEISFSNLKYSTDYTLDYSGVVAASGADLGENKAASLLNFSTKADPNAMSVVGDIAFSGLNNGDTVKFDLLSKEAGSATIYAAFYKRSFPWELVGVELEDVQVNSGTNEDVTLTLSKDIDADYVKLYVWAGENTLKPMSRVYDIKAPVETLDVLMIGNSLSEDAGRYLNNLAETAGLDLNLTVKGVGGANLSHHADNLKAELEGRTAAEAQEKMDAEEIERALYFTYIDGVYQTSTETNQLLTDAFAGGKQYDIISLQQFSAYKDSDFSTSLPYLVTTLRELQPNAEIVLYETWSNYSSSRDTRNDNFANTIEPAVSKWAKYVGANVEKATIGGEPMTIVAAGKAFYLADNKYDWCGTKWSDEDDGNTNAEAKNDVAAKMKVSAGLWRDYNHASYYGCYLADAVWYGALTGKKAPVGTLNAPVVDAPDGIEAEEHLDRLEALSNIAYQAVLEQNK